MYQSLVYISLVSSLRRFYAFAGAPVPDIFETLIKEQGKQDTLTSAHCESVKRRHHNQIEADGQKAGPIDVIVDIARKYHGKIPMAVASSGWRDHVIEGLERVGIKHLFDSIVTTDDMDVKKPKPHPDIFLVAAERIGVKAEECVGFEDADFGMQSLTSANFLYACDVRRLRMYPRNVEKRLSEVGSSQSESCVV